MNRFRDELRIVPRTARVIALLVYLGGAVCFAVFVLQRPDRSLDRPEVMFQEESAIWILASLLVPIIPTIYTLLVGYVYGDAKRRGMRYVMWTWLAALIPNAIGIILYFVLREPLLVTCPSCRTPSRSGFAFCPKCGTALAPACPGCRRASESEWTHCAYCGHAIT